MGAWGPGPFDNDDAADWLYELQESSGPAAIHEALEAIDPDEHPDDIDDDLVGRALAAVHRIESASELKDLWSESDEFDAWAGNLQDLKDRLGSP